MDYVVTIVLATLKEHETIIGRFVNLGWTVSSAGDRGVSCEQKEGCLGAMLVLQLSDGEDEDETEDPTADKTESILLQLKNELIKLKIEYLGLFIVEGIHNSCWEAGNLAPFGNRPTVWERLLRQGEEN